MLSALLTDEEAAAAIGYGLDTFKRIWPRLVAEDGLPPPGHRRKRDGTPSTRRSWDRVALERWLDSRRPPQFREARPEDPFAGERARLARRIEGLREQSRPKA